MCEICAFLCILTNKKALFGLFYLLEASETVDDILPESFPTNEFTSDFTSLTIEDTLLPVDDISSLEQPANENARRDAQRPTIRILIKRLVFKIITPKIFFALR